MTEGEIPDQKDEQTVKRPSDTGDTDGIGKQSSGPDKATTLKR